MGSFFRFLVSKVFFINLIIALLLVCGGVYGTLQYLDDYTLHGVSIEVPDLVGKQMDELDSLLGKDEFSVVIADSTYQKGLPGGKVLEQDPPAAYKVKQGRKIYVSVAAYYPPQIEMPELKDLSLRQATSLMETFGLEIGELTYQPNPCTNCIIDVLYQEVSLESGTKIAKGSEIDLIVGQGLSNELTDVPFLIGFDYKLAEDLLKSKYLNIGSLVFDQDSLSAEDSAKAQVYRQLPPFSEEPTVPMGSSIDLFLTLDTNRIDYSVNPSDTL